VVGKATQQRLRTTKRQNNGEKATKKKKKAGKNEESASVLIVSFCPALVEPRRTAGDDRTTPIKKRLCLRESL